MIYTTLNKIREHSPCTDGWGKLLKHLGKTKADDEQLSLVDILKSNGLDDALWCLRAVDGYEKEFRLYAVWCARQVQHLMKDERSIHVLDVAERYAYGNASDEELATARDAAWDAAYAASDAWDAAWNAAINAARAAAYAAWNAAWNAARDAAWDAWDAAWNAARDAAWDASDAAMDAAVAARDAQEKEFVMMCEAAHGVKE